MWINSQPGTHGFHGGQLFTADVSTLSDVSHGLEPAWRVSACTSMKT